MARHVVVDGSNIATEGRPSPSLRQLNDAVLAFMEENPGDTITVVVDATFGHRIDPKEVAEFNEAVENNEIVAPPAGAVGRGDGFVLAIADKKKASVLSNDSYQEFHGQYTWLFDEGRLIGGKPIPPDREWVFINRVPVRGPVSRKAVKDAKRKDGSPRPTKASKEANQPMPVPKAPPPGATAPTPRRGRGKGDQRARDAKPSMAPTASTSAVSAAPVPAGHTNDLLAFLSFVEHHPVGSTVRGEVSSYSSHGAYVKVGDVFGYVAMRLMATPPPRSAREKMALGETVDLVVVGFNPGRRGIDMALPGMAPSLGTPTPPSTKGAAKKAAAKKTGATAPSKKAAAKAPAKTAATKAPAKKAATKAPATKVPAKKAVAKVPAKKAVAKAPAKKAVAKKAVAKVPAKKAATKAPAKKAATKAPARKAVAKKAAAKRPAAKKTR